VAAGGGLLFNVAGADSMLLFQVAPFAVLSQRPVFACYVRAFFGIAYCKYALYYAVLAYLAELVVAGGGDLFLYIAPQPVRDILRVLHINGVDIREAPVCTGHRGKLVAVVPPVRYLALQYAPMLVIVVPCDIFACYVAVLAAAGVAYGHAVLHHAPVGYLAKGRSGYDAPHPWL